MCYGTEVMEMNTGIMDNMETFHSNMAKHVQNLPSRCSNIGSLAAVGWKNVSAHCNMLKFIFLWQLLTLPFKCVYKQVCIRRLCLLFYTDISRKGPLSNIVEACKEYGISEIVRSAIEAGDYMSKNVWKAMVKRVMGNLERKRWLIKCKLYKTLCFMSGDSYKMCTWWTHAYFDHSFARQNRVIVRLLLNVNMYLEKVCQCCDMNVVNNATHVLFECPCSKELRVRLWDEVRENMPSELIWMIERMTLSEKTRFVLNACDTFYIKEWKEMFDTLSNYIFHMCASYHSNNCGT